MFIRTGELAWPGIASVLKFSLFGGVQVRVREGIESYRLVRKVADNQMKFTLPMLHKL
jgi:hypothetical protein